MSAQPPNCDWQINKNLIKDRAKYLFESGTWSDCSFIVGSEPNQRILEGHKLILAMSSPVFEAMFFGGMAEKDPIAILDVQPEAFKALLEYIYTDKINLTSFDQACELCYAAKKYMFNHLVEQCTTYLWSDLYPKNACRAYEFAKLFEIDALMLKCIQMICSQTEDVLSETSFDDVEISTIQTLFEQEELNIESELELFSALCRYAQRHQPIASIQGEPSNHSFQNAMREALKKIRFLTLTPQQFAEGPGKSTLLGESEKFAILMNICSPSAATPMPEGFSTSRENRRKKIVDVAYISARESLSCKTKLIAGNHSENESSKKMICDRLVPGFMLRSADCRNTCLLECAVTFTCDKNICVYGIQIPSQNLVDNDRNLQRLNGEPYYAELLYAHLLDAEGSRVTYTHFTSKVNYNCLIKISFNRPVYIQKHKQYKVGVVLNRPGTYPIGSYPIRTVCNGVTFTFSQGHGCVTDRDGLIRSIIFSMPPMSNNGNCLPGISGMSGDHNMQPNLI